MGSAVTSHALADYSMRFCAATRCQVALDAIGQGSGVDRFGNVTVATGGENARLVTLHCVSGKTEDRDIAGRRAGFQPAC